MASNSDAQSFDVSLGCLCSSQLDDLAAQLYGLTINASEQDVIFSAARESILATLHIKLGRLLVLELNAARVTGELQGKDTYERWNHFLVLSSQAEFWAKIAANYPGLPDRIARIVRNRCEAAREFAEHLCADRGRLVELLGGATGSLLKLDFGAGDTHQKGKTVAILGFEQGKIVYKPRSAAIDAALQAFLDAVQSSFGRDLSIRVPSVLDCGTHGWAQFVGHCYADGDAELREFYCGIGHWLGVMRLLGGSDLHAENLIAHRGSPVVIDCETLFTPHIVSPASGLGHAFDTAAELVAGSVLSIGLLPGRGLGLGWRGVDSSALGMLPDQQPKIPMPAIVGMGTDEARLGTEMIEAPMALNHPSPQPALAKYWGEVIGGFDEMTAVLQRMDADGTLYPSLRRFSDCTIRFVPRATEVYAEIGRMLWHPVSLHGPEAATERATQLMAKMASNVASAPNDLEVIRAEIEDLLEGDVPYFTTTVARGQFDGPGGTRWLPPCDLLETTLQAWRTADIAMERNVIQASLVSAYINDGWTPEELSLLPRAVRADNLDQRRREQAEHIVRDLLACSIVGKDASIAWIAPILEPRGWAVQPLGQDLYGGISGVALLAAAYQRESAAGRANPVEGLDALLSSCLYSLQLAESHDQRLRENPRYKHRPPPPGAYIGLGSQIWTWLTLARWDMDGGKGIEHAVALAEGLSEAAAADQAFDVLIGTAGALMPTLQLHARTGDARYLRMACELGDLLCDRAQLDDDKACWKTQQWPKGLGGFAHGATGIGWALTRLARESGSDRHRTFAQAAFAFEQSLFSESDMNWKDLRMEEEGIVASAWCHGAVGIAMAHLDLDPGLEDPKTREIVRHAAAATLKSGIGWNHTLCHGDLGAWELLDAAIRVGEAPANLSSEGLLAQIISSLEEHKPTCGFARDTFAPGLLPGLGGVAYQLLRVNPQSDLPSLMTLSGGRR